MDFYTVEVKPQCATLCVVYYYTVTRWVFGAALWLSVITAGLF